ncbi:MAG: virulence RhuM family protein [Tannerella sp.]|jgi:hypothetical protein|nr:virulence RhuM family protein [Tannerella sp.]
MIDKRPLLNDTATIPTDEIQKNHPDFVIYETDDKVAKVSVRLEEETVWLTQAHLVELFHSSKANISEHIKHIFEEGELDKMAVVRKFRTTAADSKNYEVAHYNLDMIISLGYRINSKVATKFRQWATERLKEYIVKGFTLDDERLKNGGHTRHDVHQQAVEKAEKEFEIYRQREMRQLESDFDKAIKQLTQKK